jgi:hypothetical protein
VEALPLVLRQPGVDINAVDTVIQHLILVSLLE